MTPTGTYPTGRQKELRWTSSEKSRVEIDVEANMLKDNRWASLVVQWLRICLLMQGTRVRVLVWEDPTCRGATRPMSHNY